MQVASCQLPLVAIRLGVGRGARLARINCVRIMIALWHSKSQFEIQRTRRVQFISKMWQLCGVVWHQQQQQHQLPLCGCLSTGSATNLTRAATNEHWKQRRRHRKKANAKANQWQAACGMWQAACGKQRAANTEHRFGHACWGAI